MTTRIPIPDLAAGAVWHPYTPYPHQGPRVAWARGQGQYVWDQAGKRYLDSSSSWWCQILGHSHPDLVRVLHEQAGSLDHVMFAPHTHAPAEELATKLVAFTGGVFSKVFYSDNGSTAVEVAMKQALHYWRLRGDTKRTKFLSIEGGYHGDTLGTMAVAETAPFHTPVAGLSLSAGRSLRPHCYRCPVARTYPECGVACLEPTFQLLSDKGKEIAAVVLEPLVLGASGMIVYPADYVRKLVAACREAGVLVIFDEVFTGFGRTGTKFAFESIGVVPDFLCVAKGLTAGMFPMAATLTKPEIAEVFFDRGIPTSERTFFHGHTFTGNPMGCRIGVETIRILENGALAKTKPLQQLMAGAVARFEAHPRVGQVQHLGMIWAIEIVTDRTTKAIPVPPNGPGWVIAQKLFEQGYWLRPLHQRLYLVPPYCSTEADLNGFLDALWEALDVCV